MSLYIDSPGGGGGPLLKRMLLESDSVAAMRELTGAISDDNSGAFGFSDAAGNVGVLEQLPGRQIWLDGGRDAIGHANMIVSPEPADRALDCYPTRCPSAGARHHRVNAALTERRGAFDVAGGFAILSDQTDHPKSICRETTGSGRHPDEFGDRGGAAGGAAARDVWAADAGGAPDRKPELTSGTWRWPGLLAGKLCRELRTAVPRSAIDDVRLCL